MNNANQSSANQGQRDATMAGGYPPRYDARRNANAPGRANTSAVPSPYQQSYGARTRDPLDNVIRGLVDEAPPYAVLGASSTAPDLRTFIPHQLDTLKQDLRRELEEMKKAIQDDMYSTFDHESDENEARLKAELKKLRDSVITELRDAINDNGRDIEEQLPNKIEELLSTRFDEIHDKLEGQGLQMDKAIRKIDAIKNQLEEDSGYMRECGDLHLKAAERSLSIGDKLAAYLKKFEDGAASQVAGVPQAAVGASAASSSHLPIQQEAATTSTSQQNQIVPLPKATATTTPGAPASFTLSATASSISFSMNTASPLPANGTTPSASLAQLRKTRQIIHDNDEGASGSAMPSAKRPRTEEVPKGQGGSRGSSSASETLTGDDGDEEEGAGQ